MSDSPAFAVLNSETIKKRLDFEMENATEPPESVIPLLDDLFWAALWIAKNEDDDDFDWKYFTESDVYWVCYKGKWYYDYCS